MAIATLQFDRPDAPASLDAVVVDGMTDSVLKALRDHFRDYGDAARAQAEHRYVKAHVEGDTTIPLFSIYETFRAAVHANAKALQWAAFIRDAQVSIAPYCFSIRFSRD